MRYLIILFLLFFFNFKAEAHTPQSPFSIAEEDGDPIIYLPWRTKVTNGTLTKNSDNSASLSITGSGDSVTVNSTAIDTTVNIKDSSDITWAITDGGAGGPDDVAGTVVDDSHNHVITNIDSFTEAELETQLSDVSNVIVSTEIDTFSELDTLVTDKTLVNKEDAVTWDSPHTWTLADADDRLIYNYTQSSRTATVPFVFFNDDNTGASNWNGATTVWDSEGLAIYVLDGKSRFEDEVQFGNIRIQSASLEWMYDDTETFFGSGYNWRFAWDTNGAGDDMMVISPYTVEANDTTVLYLGPSSGSTRYPAGMTDHDNFVNFTFFIPSTQGADAGDYGGVDIGEHTQTDVTATHYFDFYSLAGALDGSVDATSTELGSTFRFGNSKTAADNATGAGDTVFNDKIEVDGLAYFDSTIMSAVGLDAIGAVDMDYGSADVTDHTFITDGTGTAEVVLPAGSIDGTEILDDTVDSADYAATSIDFEHLAPDVISGASTVTPVSTDMVQIWDATDSTLKKVDASNFLAGSGDITDVYNCASGDCSAIVMGASDSLDGGSGIIEIPNSSSLPGTCNVGDIYMDTDATSGQRFYLCESSNTWKLQGDGSGGGSPGGADTQIQYNNSAAFGGIANFIYDDTNIELADDFNLAFGTDADWLVQYNEGVDNQLLFITANTSAIAITDPMIEFLVGGTPTADQQVFGIAKGTQASNTALFTIDEDGDGVFNGGLTTGGTATAQSTITEGLVVNEGGGGDADDDFRAETVTYSDAFVVDASGDKIVINTNVKIDMGTNELSDAILGNLLKSYIQLPIHSAKLTGTYVTQGDATQGATQDGGDGNWRLLFDAATDEGAVWQFRMPYDYSSGLTAKIGYTMASGTANEVEFEVFVMAVTDGDAVDIGTASFDTVNVGSATVPGTVGYLDEISIALTNADSVAAGDFVAINLSTDSDDATNDDAAGDREVVYFYLEYTR